MPTIGAKVDQATYDAFFRIAGLYGVSASKFLGRLIDQTIGRHAGDHEAGPSLIDDESLRQARVAAFMSAALVRHLDQGLFDRTAAELAAAAERFEATKQNGVQRPPLTAVSGGREARS